MFGDAGEGLGNRTLAVDYTRAPTAALSASLGELATTTVSNSELTHII